MLPTYEQQKALAMQWKAAAPFLRKARHRDIRRQNNAHAMDSLNSLFQEALKTKRKRRAEGMIEMYKLFAQQQPRN